jgi:hypothetical protein
MQALRKGNATCAIVTPTGAMSRNLANERDNSSERAYLVQQQRHAKGRNDEALDETWFGRFGRAARSRGLQHGE